jgi:hypothetical protein
MIKKDSRHLLIVCAWFCALVILNLIVPAIAEARRPNPVALSARHRPTRTPTPSRRATSTPTMTVTPPSAPSPTPTPMPGMVGICGEDTMRWHPPVINGCNTGHEHGDAPPAWVGNVSFMGAFNTSAKEDTAKHASMKGFRVLLDSPDALAAYGCALDIYVRAHIAPNPMEQYSQFHSFELWVKDCAGKISHEVGWLDRGQITIKDSPESSSVRPTAILVDRAAWDRNHTCEQWYPSFGSAHPIGFTWMACAAETIYRPDLNAANPFDMSQWELTGGLGLDRRTEVVYLPKPYLPLGSYWTTQFGDLVSGPTDPVCSGTSVRYGVTYKNICLEQTIQATLASIGGLRGDLPHVGEKSYDGSGVKVPN